MAKAYVLVQGNLQDVETFGRYASPAKASVAAHGGKFIVGTENRDIREGPLRTSRTVIVEFPSREAAVRWYESAEYQALIPLRRAATTECSCVILDGVEPAP
jgi:uncharacterized protein (DUF1330 family)